MKAQLNTATAQHSLFSFVVVVVIVVSVVAVVNTALLYTA
jgi:hypothetical protein